MSWNVFQTANKDITKIEDVLSKEIDIIEPEIDPFTLADKYIIKPIESNPYIVGGENMLLSVPLVSPVFQSIAGNTSIGLNGTLIKNTPSTPSNTPTHLFQQSSKALSRNIKSVTNSGFFQKTEIITIAIVIIVLIVLIKT